MDDKGNPLGDVPLEIVERVLAAHGVFCTPQADESEYTVLTTVQGRVEVEWLPDPVYRDFLQILSRKFEIPMLHFYNPEIAEIDRRRRQGRRKGSGRKKGPRRKR